MKEKEDKRGGPRKSKMEKEKFYFLFSNVSKNLPRDYCRIVGLTGA